VTAAAGFANYEFTYPVEIVVGEASQALKLDTDSTTTSCIQARRTASPSPGSA
jgi:hypothetical protein